MYQERLTVPYATDKVWMDQMVQGYGSRFSTRQDRYVKLPQNFIDIQDDVRYLSESRAAVTIRRAQRGDKQADKAWKKNRSAVFLVRSEDQKNVKKAKQLCTEWINHCLHLYEQGKRFAKYRDLPQNKARFSHANDSKPVAVQTKAAVPTGYRFNHSAARGRAMTKKTQASTGSYNYTVKAATAKKAFTTPALPKPSAQPMEPKTFQFSNPETAKKLRSVVNAAEQAAQNAENKRHFITYPDAKKVFKTKDGKVVEKVVKGQAKAKRDVCQKQSAKKFTPAQSSSSAIAYKPARKVQAPYVNKHVTGARFELTSPLMITEKGKPVEIEEISVGESGYILDFDGTHCEVVFDNFPKDSYWVRVHGGLEDMISLEMPKKRARQAEYEKQIAREAEERARRQEEQYNQQSWTNDTSTWSNGDGDYSSEADDETFQEGFIQEHVPTAPSTTATERDDPWACPTYQNIDAPDAEPMPSQTQTKIDFSACTFTATGLVRSVSVGSQA